MTTNIVRLHDSEPNATGRRYTSTDREAAYLCWRTAAGRSQRKAAEMLNIAPSTIGTWSQTDGWVKRAEQEDADEAAAVRTSIAGRLTSELDKSIGTIVAIRDDPTVPARDRLNAATFLLGVAGIAPVAKTQSALVVERVEREKRGGETIDISNLSTVEDLIAAEQELRSRRRSS